MKSRQPLDLITVGRAGVDLYGQQIGGRLEQMSTFAKYVGGSPANIAIGTARLGLKSALLTRVGQDHMGRFIVEQMQREGVNTQGIISDAQRLTALVILGVKDQDSFPLIFYRENCADMALDESEINADFIQSARAVLVTGTHFSTDNTAKACKKAIGLAKKVGAQVIFDVDYRPVLWGLVAKELGESRFIADLQVTAELQTILPDCDLVVGTEEELHILAGTDQTIAAIQRIRQLTQAVIVCKRGPKGCAVFDKDIPASLDEGIQAEGVEIEVYNVLGAGDAFLSGFLAAWLKGESLLTCCRYANVCGAIVVSRLACSAASPTRVELDHFLRHGSAEKALRHDQQLEHIHWVSTRTKQAPSLKVLAIDHRSQFLQMVNELNVDAKRIDEFKLLALQALHKVAAGDPSFGILLDGRFGMRALEQAADLPYWIGRPIEVPGSRPLRFEGSADVAAELNSWPANHVVKCLVFYHPDDEASLKAEQENQLLRLADACRKTSHELLLEIICSKYGIIQADTVANCMERLYHIGIRPDWWKLEPSTNKAHWQTVEQVISANDPYCRGIVLLGLCAAPADLLKAFELASHCKLIKGFAVGRTIFSQVAHDWLQGSVSDEQARLQLQENFSVLVNGWDGVYSG